MRFVSLALIALCAPLALASTVEESKNNIRRLSDHIYNEVNTSEVSYEELLQVEEKLNEALEILRGQTVPEPEPIPIYDRSACVKYVLDANYPPSTASETCDTISSDVEMSCVKMVMEKNFSPSRAANSCQSIVSSELSCFEDVLNRNYSPDKARETCIVIED